VADQSDSAGSGAGRAATSRQRVVITPASDPLRREGAGGVGVSGGDSASASRVYVLRHSAAARMIAAGASPKAVQTILGHGYVGFILTTYGHVFDADHDDPPTASMTSRGLSAACVSFGAPRARLTAARPARLTWARKGSNLRPRDYEPPALAGCTPPLQVSGSDGPNLSARLGRVRQVRS
jgi:hypothetical protein